MAVSRQVRGRRAGRSRRLYRATDAGNAALAEDRAALAGLSAVPALRPKPDQAFSLVGRLARLGCTPH